MAESIDSPELVPESFATINNENGKNNKESFGDLTKDLQNLPGILYYYIVSHL